MKWHALILAAGRGPDDPMAKAYRLSHKCMIPVGGVPMLQRVIATLKNSPLIESVSISIESGTSLAFLPADLCHDLQRLDSGDSAAASVRQALKILPLPLLITTADHALLTVEMVDYFCSHAQKTDSDFAVGLATADIIQQAYPQTKRTYFRLSPPVSGCNLFALKSLKCDFLLERWQTLEQVRKKPWRLISAFGARALLLFVGNRLSLRSAFDIVSHKCDLKALPILLPYPEAAIDVDKMADKELVEKILYQSRLMKT